MEDYILISAQDFCLSHEVRIETVQILSDYGLITFFIPENQIKRLEKILVFNNELDINLEGIETIFDLLERIEGMQDHILQLENKLQRFL